MKTHTLWSILALALLLVSPLWVGEARGQGPGQAGEPNKPVSNAATPSTKAMADTAAYWTPERMAAAQPMALRSPKAGATPGGVDSSQVLSTSPAQFFPGSPPGEPARPAISAQAAGIQPATVVGTAWYTYPFPYTWSFMGAGWPQFYPMRTNGKLWFTQNSTDYECSGTVVTSGSGGNNRLVATAGQCVHAGDGLESSWSTNVRFCPGYWAPGSPAAPWGCWESSHLWTLDQWKNSADLRYDHGFIVTTPFSDTGNGAIGVTIGTNGVASNYSLPQDIWSFGYPVESPYFGGSLVWTTSGVAVIDDPGYGSGPYPFGIGSDQTAGATGGAWSMGQRIAVAGYVISHSDYKYSATQPLAMYGPYQGDDWRTLYDAARVDNP
jgi:hypothetical protein